MNDSTKQKDFTSEIAIVTASFAALPKLSDLDRLVVDSDAALSRGYYDPVEDERLRETYARYLAIRVSLWEVVQGLKMHYKGFLRNSLDASGQQAFAIAFAASEIIVRTGEYLINLARDQDIVWKKLDEAEGRYGLERKSFTRLYRQLTSITKMHNFYRACDYFDDNRETIMSAIDLDPFYKIRKILTDLNLPGASRGDHLWRYKRFFLFSLRRRRLSAMRNVLFSIFEGTGEDVADMTIPLVKAHNAPKRVTAEIVEQLLPDLRPGDVFITRHDDAMSNLFLPGFWPHGALFIGEYAQREALGLSEFSDKIKSTADHSINVIESKKDGVLLRELSDTLTVDAFVVLRPRLTEAQIKLALERGLSHGGKLYDFIFDFSTSDRLVCTEVIYRAYHGIGNISFELSDKAGRKCLSAEDFLNQAIKNCWFEPIIIYGVGDNQRYNNADAKTKLRQSFEAEF